MAELDVVGLLVGLHVVGVVQQFERPRLCLPFYALRSTVSLVRRGDELCAVVAVAVAVAQGMDHALQDPERA